MKKIVSILAVAAMAASMFAVDFSAGVRLQGDLFNYDAEKKSLSVLEEHHENQFYQVPMSFAISDDKAGGQLKFSNVGADGGDGVTADAWSVWFKPADAFKITVGRWSTNLNQEHIGWCNTDSGIETDGYALSLGSGAFTADIFFASKNKNAWLTKVGDADAAMAELYGKVNYGADFGTINAFFDGINSFKDFRFGAGFNVAGLPVGLWFNVIGAYCADEFNRIRVEADVSGAAGSIGYELFLAGGYYMSTNIDAYDAFCGTEKWHVGGSYYLGKAAAFCGFYARLNVPVAGVSGYLELKEGDLLDGNFSMTIKPGFKTSVGCAAVECALEVTAQKNIKVAVPVNFAVSF